MARKAHPEPVIEAAIRHAEAHGWRIQEGESHAWGRMLCPYNGDSCRCGEYCITIIWSTPANAGNHGKQLRRAATNPHASERSGSSCRNPTSNDE
jgi:hypothetical protein